MESEYVSFTDVERRFIEENYLNVHLEFLGMIKKLKAYSLLRREELLLKIKLKAKFEEIFTKIELFEKCLPKIRSRGINEERVEKKTSEDFNLEREIEEVRWKLERLKADI